VTTAFFFKERAAESLVVDGKCTLKSKYYVSFTQIAREIRVKLIRHHCVASFVMWFEAKLEQFWTAQFIKLWSENDQRKTLTHV